MSNEQLYTIIGTSLLNTALILFITSRMIDGMNKRIDDLRVDLNKRLDDLRELFRAEMKTMAAELRSEMRAMAAELRAEIRESSSRLIK